jgi:hypothetical protein
MRRKADLESSEDLISYEKEHSDNLSSIRLNKHTKKEKQKRVKKKNYKNQGCPLLEYTCRIV